MRAYSKREIINALSKSGFNDIKVSKFEKVGIALGVWAKYNLVY